MDASAGRSDRDGPRLVTKRRPAVTMRRHRSTTGRRFAAGRRPANNQNTEAINKNTEALGLLAKAIESGGLSPGNKTKLKELGNAPDL